MFIIYYLWVREEQTLTLNLDVINIHFYNKKGETLNIPLMNNVQCIWTLKLNVINIHFASNIDEMLNIPLMHYVQCILTLNLDVINIHFASNIYEILNSNFLCILSQNFNVINCHFCFKYRWNIKYSHSEQVILVHFWSCLFVPYMVLHGIVYCAIFHVLKIIYHWNSSYMFYNLKPNSTPTSPSLK